MGDIRNKNNFGLFFIIFLTSFLTGVIFSFYVGKTINTGMLKEIKTNESISLFQGDHDLNLEKFWQVYNIIKHNNYDADIIQKEELVDHAIKGLVEGLGDRHSEYMTADETEKFNDILAGDLEGIGAVVEKIELGVKISRVIKGSPAKKYGILSDDIIISANGESLEELELYEAVEKIKGPAGTTVTLEILRKGEPEVLSIDVVRDKIKIPSVDSRVLDGTNIGYIALNMFGDDTADEFEKALKSLENVDGLIIDLRDNGGGYLQSAVQILSYFIENDEVIVRTRYKDSFFDTVYKSFNSGNVYDKKIVVLINENSASASEITAGVLSDYGKAILVGKKSYGKGSVQKPFDLDDGSSLKLTIAKWFTPKDRNIDKEGIDPDIEVEFQKEDYENNYDRQLEEAKKILQKYIELGAIKLTIDSFNKN